MRSESAITSSMRWVMKRTRTALAGELAHQARRPPRGRRNRAPPSPRRGSGCAARGRAARASTTSCWAASGSRPAGGSSDTSVLAKRREHSSRRGRGGRCAGRCGGDSPSRPSRMLSVTERSGAISTSWKTVAKPAAWKARRVASGEGLCRPIRICAAVGRDDAGEELDQGALARAVLAQDRVDRCPARNAIDASSKRDRLAVALGDVRDLEHRARLPGSGPPGRTGRAMVCASAATARRRRPGTLA